MFNCDPDSSHGMGWKLTSSFRHGSGIEVGADEGIHSLEDIKRHRERNAARGVSLKAIKLGGTTALVEAGRLCAQLNMSVNISCMTGVSSIACAAALHAASVLPDIAWALTLTHTGLAEDISGAPVPTANGHVDVLKRPGLDVEVAKIVFGGIASQSR